MTLENVLLLEPCHEAWTNVIAGINDYNPYSTSIEALQTCGKGIGDKVSVTQCAIIRIFMLLRFYVKPILENLEVQNLHFSHF